MAEHVLLVLLSSLIISLPVPFHARVARAEDSATPDPGSDGFNFKDQSAALDEAAVAGTGSNAIKVRTAPVTASGAFGHAVPIEVPPGRAGMTPGLALTYASDSHRHDSPVGAGWSFEVPRISRDSRNGYPPRKRVGRLLKYDDDATQFTGPTGRLMPLSAARLRDEGFVPAAGAKVYAPLREHDPVRYEYFVTPGRWVEHLPNGTKRYYGAADNRFGHIVNELGPHAWLLLKERDADGNTIEYDYWNLDGELGQERPFNYTRAQAVPVLRSVRWGANDRAGLPHLFRVETQVQPYDGQLDMLNGHVVLTTKVTRIRVLGPDPIGTSSGERLYWDYALELEQSPDTPRLLLKSITRQGYDPSSASGTAQGSPVVHRFTYQNNVPLSARQGTAVCDAATRAAYGPMTTLGSRGQEDLYRSGFRPDVHWDGGRPRIRSSSWADLSKNNNPIDVLSPDYRGAGFRLEDFDADGDLDVIYHPAGLGSPSSRWLQHRSFFDVGPGRTFQRVAINKDASYAKVLGISGDLLVSSFSDVDGDTDLDGVAFPLFWSSPIADGIGLEEYKPNYRITSDQFDINNLTAAQKRDVISRVLARTVTGGFPRQGRQGCIPTNVFTPNGGTRLKYRALAYGVPGLDGFTPDPTSLNPLPPIDPTLPREEIIRQIAGVPCDQLVEIPSALGGDEFGSVPVSEGTTEILVARNSAMARSNEEAEFVARVNGWPSHVGKFARWVMVPHLVGKYATVNLLLSAEKAFDDLNKRTTDPRIIWDADFRQASDFMAPVTDVDGDGRADIVLLKSMEMRPATGNYFEFIPRVFLSNGSGFVPERPMTGVAIDVTGIANVDWLALGILRSYDAGTRRALAAMRPGDVLPLDYLDLLPNAAFRREANSVVAAYGSADPEDLEARMGFQAALLDVFDRGVELVAPRPRLSLRGMFQRAMTNLTFGVTDWLGFNLAALPDVPIDVTNALISAGSRTLISLEDVAFELDRAQLFDAIAPLNDFAIAVAPYLGINVFELMGPNEQATSGFTTSAVQVLNEGKNTRCPKANEQCDSQTPYPVSISFNSFLADLNGDGLPELIAAHRPDSTIPRERELAEEGILRRMCGTGHQVHLNRGYRWDDLAEASNEVTMSEGWSGTPISQQKSTGPERDGALELLNQHSPSCQQFPLIEAGGNPRSAYAGLPMAATSFADINADGLTDAVFAAITHEQAPTQQNRNQGSLEQHIYLNTGRSFVKTAFTNQATVYSSGNGQYADTQPWCGLPSDFYMTEYVRSNGSTYGTQDRARLVDVDSDGLLDVLYRGDCQGDVFSQYPCTLARWRRNLRKVPDLLTDVSTSGGAWTHVDYLAATSDEAHSQGVVPESNRGRAPIGHQVVAEVRRGAGANTAEWQPFVAGDYERIRMSYQNFVRESGSAGSVGFEKVTARFYNRDNGVETANPVVTTTTYDVRAEVPGVALKSPLRGAVIAVETTDMATGHAVTTSTQYGVQSFETGARIRPDIVVTTTRMDSVNVSFATEQRNRDVLGYPQTTVSGRSLNGARVSDTHPETTLTTIAYAHRPTDWRLGRVASLQVAQGSVSTPAPVLAREATTYDASSGRVDTKWVQKGAGESATCGTVATWATTKYEQYNAAGNPERIVENGGRTIHVRYDANQLNVARRWTNIPASESSPGVTLEEQTAFDLRFGARRYTRDFNGDARQATYDTRGRLTGLYGPGNVVLETHAYTDPTGSSPASTLTTSYVDAGKSFTSRAFLDGMGRTLATITSAATGTSPAFIRSRLQRYDAFGRLVASYQPRGVSADTTAAASIDASDKAATTAYDGFDRVVRETTPDGRNTTHVYGAVIVNNLAFARVTTTNPRANVTRRRFDSRGNLTAVEHMGPASSTVPIASFDYQRDGLGRITSVVDRDASIRNFSYDVGGRVITGTLPYTSAPDALSYTYCYDADDKLVHAVTPASRELFIDRDVLGRSVQVEAGFERPSGSQLVDDPTIATYEYDCSADDNTLGRLCSRTDAVGTSFYTYDDLGRRSGFELAFSDTIADSLPPSVAAQYSASYTWTLSGQLKSAVYDGLGAGQHRLDYTLDNRGRPTAIAVDDPIAAPRALVKSVAYDELERVTAATLGNDVVETWGYDMPSGRLLGVGLSQGTNTFSRLAYPLASYDANDNPKREERYVGTTLKSLKLHTFDALDRVASSNVQMDGTARQNESFTYSTAGNLSTAGALQYTYGDVANRQAVTRIQSSAYSRSITYDDDGWVTGIATTGEGAGSQTLAFDAAGCLRYSSAARVGTANPTVTSSVCGMDGKRAFRETRHPDGSVERVFYLPDGAELRPDQNLFIMRLPVGRATVAHLAWSLSGQGIVASESGYVHSDLRGSVIARTGITASNVQAFDQQAEYDAWGNTLTYANTAAPRYRFTGEEPDPGTGYYFLGARAYDPQLRRWLSPDPLFLLGVEADADSGANLNLYAYAANNPVRMVDPTGNIPVDTIWDAGNVLYDLGKAAVGYVTGNPAMVAEGLTDAAIDAGAMLIPYVPAGLTKVDDAAKVLSKADDAIDAAKAADKGAEVAKGTDKAADAAKSGENAASVEKKVPNPDGSRGSKAHQDKIEERIQELVDKEGHEHVAGGRTKKEEVIQTPGGSKESRRPDITTKRPDGTLHRENVGKARKDGEPIARERRALDDIEQVTGERPMFTPYN